MDRLAYLVKQKNFLIKEGRALVSGDDSNITKGEWLYFYEQIEGELEGLQAEILSKLKNSIKELVSGSLLDNISV